MLLPAATADVLQLQLYVAAVAPALSSAADAADPIAAAAPAAVAAAPAAVDAAEFGPGSYLESEELDRALQLAFLDWPFHFQWRV